MAEEESPVDRSGGPAEERTSTPSTSEDDDAGDGSQDDRASTPPVPEEDAAAPPSKPPAPAERTRYRRWHTLSGAVALAAFLVEHLVTNASALGGEASYDAVMRTIQRSSVLPLFEVVFIALPLGFHAGYGIHLLRRPSTPDSEVERYGDRRLWVLQRMTAVLVLLFVLGHLLELRFQRLFFGLSADALPTTLAAHFSWTWAGVPWFALLYLLGLLATAVHLSNGLFAATHAWGIAVDPAGRRRTRIGLTVFGALLFFLGAASVVSLATGSRLFQRAETDLPCGADMAPPAPLLRPLPTTSPSR